MMRKNLRSNWSDEQFEGGMATVGLDGTVRAERVTLDQFARLAETLNESAQNPEIKAWTFFLFSLNVLFLPPC